MMFLFFNGICICIVVLQQKRYIKTISLRFVQSELYFVPIGLDQLQMAPLVPDDSLQRLYTTKGKVCVLQHETFFIRDK